MEENHIGTANTNEPFAQLSFITLEEKFDNGFAHLPGNYCPS
jgi:hypothetical protein